MNTFKICFSFDNKVRVAEVTAEQIAGYVMSNAYDIQSLADNIFETNSDFQHEFPYNGKYYIVTFSYDDVKLLNIFERNSKEDGDSEHLVEENVPYTLIAAYKDNHCYWNMAEEI